MADYDLGTAHGRIVIDYDDKGMRATEKDLVGLEKQTKSLLSRFGAMASKWRSQGQDMANTAKNVAKGVGLITGVAIAAHTAMNGFGASLGILREARSVIGDIGTALGAVPAGMEGFPTAVRRVVQLNAAVAVFTGTLGLLARSTSSLRGIRVVTGLLGRFGGVVSTLAGPLRLVSTLAFAAVTAFKAFAFTKQIIKYMGALNLAIGAVGGSIHVISGLAASVRDLSKAALLLPAVIGAGALALGTFKIATLGVGDALKALDDPAKFAEALKKLSPAAREAVTEVQKLVKPFKDIQQQVQQRFFEGLGKVVSDLGGLYLPILQGGLEQVAGSFNRTIKEVAAFFNTFEGSNEVANDFAEGLDFSARGIDNLLKAVAPLTRAFYLLWRVGSEVFAEITGGAGAAAQKFADFIGEARASGDLKRWMLEGVQAVKDLIAIVVNLGRILTTVFDGLNGGSGQTFLGFLRQATDSMLRFLKSAEGQDVLRTLGDVLEHAYQNTILLANGFIKYILPAIKAFLPFLRAMSEAVGTGLVAAMAVLGPIFEAIGNALSYLAPIMGPIVTVMVFLTTTAIGLAVAFGIVGKAILIFRTGLLLVRGALAIFGGLFRLLTGNLGPVGRAVLALARFLGGALLRSIFSVAGALKLLKFGAIVAAIGVVKGALQGYSEEQRKAFDTGTFQQDTLTFWEQFKKTPFQAIGMELRESLTPPPTLNQDLKKIGDSFMNDLVTPALGAGAKIKASFETDFIGFFAALPGRIGGFFSTVGTSISTGFQTALTFIQNLPAVIGTYLAGLGTSLYTAASNAWTSFITATNAKFIELGGTVGSLPYRLGVALGSLIGMGLKWAVDLWTSFQTATVTKFTEIVAFVQTLPTRIATALTNLGTTLMAKATEVWTNFQTASQTKIDGAVADVQAIPGKVGAALSSFVATVVERATTAWNNFRERAAAGIATAVAFVSGLPGRIGAALAALPGILQERATAAFRSFQTSVTSGAQTALAFIQGIPGRILSALGNMGNLLVGAGRAVINGLLAGIRAGVQAMYDFVSGIAAGIAARKGPLPYDRRLLIPQGNAIINGLRQGMAQALPGLYKMVGGIASNVSGAMDLSSSMNLTGTATAGTVTGSAVTAPKPYTGPTPSGGDGATSGTNNFNVSIPAKDIAEMQTVSDFFNKVQQRARAGKATG